MMDDMEVTGVVLAMVISFFLGAFAMWWGSLHEHQR